MIRKRIGSIFTILLLMLLAFSFDGIHHGFERVSASPDDGINGYQELHVDWTVSNYEEYDDEIIALFGNLIIKNGGQLVLNNCTLMMMSSFLQPYSITIRNNGTLEMNDCYISDSPKDNDTTSVSAWYYLMAKKGSTLKIENSTIRQCGFLDTTKPEHLGLSVATKNGHISNTTINTTVVGISFTGNNTGFRLENVNISDISMTAGYLLNAQGLFIKNISFNNVNEKVFLVIRNSKNFLLEDQRVYGKHLFYVEKSSSFTLKNIIGDDSERLFNLRDCSNFNVMDISLTGAAETSDIMDIKGCLNGNIANIITQDIRGLFDIGGTSGITISNVTGYNTSSMMRITESDDIEIFDLTINKSSDTFVFTDCNQITMDDININNVSKPIWLNTVSNSTISNITLTNISYAGMIIESESKNITVSNLDLESNGQDFPTGLSIKSSEINLNNFYSNNIDWGLDTDDSKIYGENININNTVNDGERGIQIRSAREIYLSNVTIQNQKWDGMRIENTEKERIRMNDVFINDADTGINLRGGNLTVSDLVIENTIWNITAYDNSEVTIMNSTIGSVELYYSDAIFINTTNTTGAGLSGTATLTKKWWVDVFVEDTVGSIAGADVRIYDGTLALEVVSQTDLSGYARNVPVTEVVYSPGPTITSKNPHLTTASGTGWFVSNSTFYQVKNNMLVNVTYSKNAPPNPPTNLIARSDKNSNTVLTWEESISQDVSKYNIYIANSKTSLKSIVSSGTPNYTTSQPSFMHISGSKDWQQFWYGVRANDSENESMDYIEGECGDWVINITDPQNIENENIILIGDLLVFGQLNLNKSVLKINSTDDVSYGIEINNSAIFSCDNITINRNNINPYYFNMGQDSVVTINDSHIIRPGTDVAVDDESLKGLNSYTKKLTITNTKMNVEFGGLRIIDTKDFEGSLDNITFQSENYYSTEYLLNITNSPNIDITNCSLTGVAKYGIYIQGSSDHKISSSVISIQNDNYIGNYGIYMADCSDIQIFNNSMIFGDPALYFIDSINITIESSHFTSPGNIAIYGESSGYATVQNCDFGTEQRKSSNPIYMSWCSNSIIKNMDLTDQSVFLIMENESASIIRNISIATGELAIWLINSEDISLYELNLSFIYAGIKITGCRDIYMSDSVINLTFYCLEIKSPGPIQLLNCSIANGIGNEIIAEGYNGHQGEIILINSSITSLTNSSLQLNNSAVVSLINTGFNFTNLKIKDSASRVEIYHYISIQVFDIDNNTPIWSNITILNVNDRYILNQQVNFGFAPWITIHQRTIFKEEEYSDNPHILYFYDGSHFGSKEIYINSSGHLDVYVSNDLPWLSSVDIYGYYKSTVTQEVTETYEPTTKFDINLTYLYEDTENDLEIGTTIHWYVNGVYNSTFDGMNRIEALHTSKYQTWKAIVYPSDGYDNTYPSYPYGSNVLYIANTAPEVKNVTLSPSEPISGDDLLVHYETYDIDIDGLDSSKTSHKWYYYNETENDWAYSNIDSLTLSKSYTAKAQRWRCEVTPNDGDHSGITMVSTEVVIGNTPPTISSAIIIPLNPISNQSLNVSYIYSDTDSDSESGSTIKWFKNDIEQLELNGSVGVPHSMTKKGEKWKYLIIPSDGTDFGGPQESTPVTIGNTAPRVANITILPINPTTNDDLTVNYQFIDVDDGDSESFETSVQWLRKREGDLDFAYTGLRVKTLSAIYTAKNEIWTCEVTPHDKLAYGKTVQAEINVTILNSAPSVSEISINPKQPHASNDLQLTYKFSDSDNDLESGTEIKWFQNGIEIDEFENKLTISSNYTAKGQTWFFTVRPSDGQDYGETMQSVTSFIQNSPPMAKDVKVLPNSPTGLDDLNASYTYYDEDNDNESAPELKWFENGIHQPEFDDKLTVNSSSVDKDENWHFEIRIYDGTDYSDWVSSNHPKIGNSKAFSKSIIPAVVIGTTVIINETDSQIFQVKVDDPDGDLIVHYWRLDGQLVSQDYFYTFTTEYEGEHSAGRYNLSLEFREYRETEITIIDWEIVVSNVNRPPKINSWSPVSKNSKLEEEKSLTFSVSASDPDKDDNLNFKWYFDDTPIPGQKGSSYAYTGTERDIGEHKIKVEVLDNAGAKDEYFWNITVKQKDEGERLYGQTYDWWGLVIAIISGIAAIIVFLFGFVLMRRKKSKLQKYMKQIRDIKESSKPEKTKEEEIIELKNQIWDEFSNGLVTENHYIILEREVDNALGEVRKGIIEGKVAMPKKLKDDVSEILEDGMVTRTEYRAIAEKIASSSDLSNKEKGRLNRLMRQWMNESEADILEDELDEEIAEVEEEPEISKVDEMIDEDIQDET